MGNDITNICSCNENTQEIKQKLEYRVVNYIYIAFK